MDKKKYDGTDGYILLRSNRKSLSLCVDANGRIVVRAPKPMRMVQIERFVTQHTDWIERRRRQLESARPDFSDGAVLVLYGQRYTIGTGARARIANDRILLPALEREKALISLLKKISRQYMSALVRELAEEYQFKYASVRCSSARGRWGSCSAKGNLSFSFRTVFLSEREARYIAVHELCHTRHMDHSPAFWAEVKAIIPDCLLIRRGLKNKSSWMLFL